MFNRELQVKMVKTNKSKAEQPDTTDAHYEGVAAIAGYTIDRVVKKVGMFAIGYVVLDTFRQVLVATANK